MNTDLKSQLARYGEYHREEQAAIEPADIMPNDGAIRTLSFAGHPDTQSARNRRGVLVTVAVAVVVLSLVGGLTYLLRATEGASDPAESPTTPTSPIDALAIEQVEGLIAAVNRYDFDAYAQIVPVGSVIAEGRAAQGWCGDPWCDVIDRPDEAEAFQNVKDVMGFLAILEARWSVRGCVTAPAVASVGGTTVTCTVTYQSLDRATFFEPPTRERLLFRTSRFGESLAFSNFKVTGYSQLGNTFTRWARAGLEQPGKTAAPAERADPCQLLPREGDALSTAERATSQCATWVVGEVEAFKGSGPSIGEFELVQRAAGACLYAAPYTIGEVNPWGLPIVPVGVTPPAGGFWWSLYPNPPAVEEWLTFYDGERSVVADLLSEIDRFSPQVVEFEQRRAAWDRFDVRFDTAVDFRAELARTLRDDTAERDQEWFEALGSLIRETVQSCRDVQDSAGDFFPDR